MANRIIQGLESALSYARCDHDWSEWFQMPTLSESYRRECAKCLTRETRIVFFTTTPSQQKETEIK